MRTLTEIFHQFISLSLFLQLFLVVAIIAFLSACGGGSSNDTTAPEPELVSSISIEVVDVPKAFKSNGQWQVVYELVINNTGETTVSLQSLNIQSDNVTLENISSNELSSFALENSVTIAPESLTALFLWIESDSLEKPSALVNKVVFSTPSSESVEQQFTLELDESGVTTLSRPLQNSDWKALAINNNSHHRRSFMMFNDQPKFAQRYAIDWVKVDESGNWYSGDGLANQDHFAYGENVYASTAGEVVKVINGYPDNLPGQPADESTPLAGNYVVLKTESDEYILIAHLIADSIIVKEGDIVDASQLIGRIGNSGNSSAPHLHFHLAKDIDLESPSSLNAVGVPYHFDQFEVTSGATELGLKTIEMPNERAVISF